MSDGQKMSLTPRQRDAFNAIEAHIAEKGTGPTVRELTARLELKSTSQTDRLIKGLVSRGWVKKIAGGHRSLTPVENKQDSPTG